MPDYLGRADQAVPSLLGRSVPAPDIPTLSLLIRNAFVPNKRRVRLASGYFPPTA
jgi:hypothetical protein